MNSNITLTLSPRTATALVSILNKVGGPHEGPRGNIDRLLRTLSGAGVPYVYIAQGTIVMADNWNIAQPITTHVINGVI